MVGIGVYDVSSMIESCSFYELCCYYIQVKYHLRS